MKKELMILLMIVSSVMILSAEGKQDEDAQFYGRGPGMMGGNRFSDEEIADLVGADSLAYGWLSTVKKAILGSREDCDLCTGCINYPDGYPDDLRDKLVELYDNDTPSSCRAYE